MSIAGPEIRQLGNDRISIRLLAHRAAARNLGNLDAVPRPIAQRTGLL